MADGLNPEGGICAAIIAAGGSGSRMGAAVPKQFLELGGLPLLLYSLRAFAAVAEIGRLVICTRADYLEHTRKLAARHGFTDILVVVGGDSRQESVAHGLAALAASGDEIALVAVHDGARPLVTPDLIHRCLAAARRHGAAIAAIEVRDTLKRAEEESGSDSPRIAATIDRAGLWQAQTPQVARFSLLQEALQRATADDFTGTDEAALLERQGQPVALVRGDAANLKVTHPDDLLLAEALLIRNTPPKDTPRIGHGYDVHRLVAERRLILGGVEIPHPLGLLGHSDADVLTHALCDALLGALGAGDIGRHFPDHDPSYRGISSLKLLATVMEQVTTAGYRLGNADLTVIAQEPKLAPHLPEMREKLAAVCRVSPEQINLKATTTEGLGFAGRREGIAAHAVVLLM